MKKIQFDGASIPNPGPMGIGVVLIEDQDVVEQISERLLEEGSNNVAEYSALIRGLQRVVELHWNDIIVEGDSKLVVNQINGEWKVKKDHLKLLYNQAQNLMKKFKSVQITRISGEKNSLADHLACKALGYNEDPYHNLKQHIQKSHMKTSKNVKEDSDTKCPKCKSECTFQWQIFENGTRHIKQICPRDGYVKYAPNTDFYKKLADKEKEKQQTLF
jgi:ribonuclease HI